MTMGGMPLCVSFSSAYDKDLRSVQSRQLTKLPATQCSREHLMNLSPAFLYLTCLDIIFGMREEWRNNSGTSTSWTRFNHEVELCYDLNRNILLCRLIHEKE